MSKGFFISFEAVDGVGKTTQVELLVAALRSAGYDVLQTKEPGGANIGPGIREMLFKNPGMKTMHPGVADMLFLADHIQTAGDIAIAVAAGKVVVCDRYADSQFAYAASPTKAAPDWALKAYQEQFGIVPDVTFLLLANGPMVAVPFPAPCNRGMRLNPDISWALRRANARRGVELGKQDGKSWNSVDEQLKIQGAYVLNLFGLERMYPVHIWEDDSIETVHSFILPVALERLRQATF